jgi:antitoxin component of RelBE/YafQ-DinJ toxin-antitoxin module
MNQPDNQNKFDVEMNHSFPFDLSIQNENKSANKETMQSTKNKNPD